MKLFLLRHADALDGDDDALRPLSPSGQATVVKLALFLKGGELLEPMPLWHSGLVRSEETARLFKEQMGWKRSKLIPTEDMSPEDPPVALAISLEHVSKDLLIVGHEPHLGRFTSLLLTGEEDALLIKIRKCALLCLERKDKEEGKRKSARWKLRWLLDPKLLG